MIARQLLRFGKKLQDLGPFRLRSFQRPFQRAARPRRLVPLQPHKAHAQKKPRRSGAERDKPRTGREEAPSVARGAGLVRLLLQLRHERLAHLPLIFAECMCPDRFIRLFQMRHVARGVHERRGLHARAQRAAQEGERFPVGGEGDRLFHIFIIRMRTADVSKADVRQKARAEA